MTTLTLPSSKEPLWRVLGPPVSRFDCGPVAETQTGSSLVAKLFAFEGQTDNSSTCSAKLDYWLFWTRRLRLTDSWWNT